MGTSPEPTLPAADLGLTDGSLLYGEGPAPPGETVTVPASEQPMFSVWAL
ncbi:MAG: hypothetical protein ABI873_00380 [Marmoricola sp.]